MNRSNSLRRVIYFDDRAVFWNDRYRWFPRAVLEKRCLMYQAALNERKTNPYPNDDEVFEYRVPEGMPVWKLASISLLPERKIVSIRSATVRMARWRVSSPAARSMAETELRTRETAEMQLYAGMGYVLRVRMLGIRKENRAAAHAAVKARTHLMRALEMDPSLADAKTGLGLYNYYVDTLSGIARMLRAFMGLPGGDKRLGVAQLEDAMLHGELTGVDARFYLAKNFRSYDQEYERALKIMEPLAERYWKNPIFPLFIGNLNALLGRSARAAANYHAAEILAAALPSTEGMCKARVEALAREGLGIIKAR